MDEVLVCGNGRFDLLRSISIADSRSLVLLIVLKLGTNGTSLLIDDDGELTIRD